MITAPVSVAKTDALGPRLARNVGPASAPMVAAVPIWLPLILVSMSFS
jgi:hypothetical protein